MPQNLNKWLFLLFTCTFLASCVFHSDDDYFNDIPAPDPASVGVDIKNINISEYNEGDTIDIFGSTYFFYSLNGQHGEVESAYVYMSDEKGVWNNIASATSGSFHVGLYSLKSGIFGLELRLVMRTGSGSLADKSNAETFAVTKRWKIRVDLSPPPRPVTTLSVADGFLTLQWPAYTKSNFTSYVVKRTLSNGASKTFEIEDKQISSWRDSTYVGGYAEAITYAVTIVSETGSATSVPIPRTDPIPVTFSFNPLDSVVTVQWRKTKFYGTFKDYKFTAENARDVPAITNINDTTLIYKYSDVRFGDPAYVGLTVRSKREGISDYYNGTVYNLGTPLPFKPAGQIAFNTYLNRLIAEGENQELLELNEEFQSVKTITTLQGNRGLEIPYPGRYVYYSAIPYDDSHIYRVDLADNSEVAYAYTYLRSSSYSVAGNGLICVDYTRLPYSNHPVLFATRAFDPVDDTSPVYSEQSNTTNLTAVLSDDGKFIWANDSQIFKISNGSSTLVGTLTGVGSFYGFRPDNGNEVMFLDKANSKVNFYDANTLEFIRSIDRPGGEGYWFTSYDTQTKNMLWTYGSSRWNIYIVNIETGVTTTIPISYKAVSSDMYLVNGLLISKDYYIKVK